MEAVQQFTTIGAERHHIGECLGRLVRDEWLHCEFDVRIHVEINVPVESDDVGVGVDGRPRRATTSALTAVSLKRTGLKWCLR